MKLNGQQKAEENVAAFHAWVATQSDEDFRQIIHRSQLNRGEIAKGVGCGKSALRQNPALKDALEQLETKLRDQEVLPPLTDKAESNKGKPQEYDPGKSRSILESKRLSALEAENIELKVRVAELEGKLERYGELSETLSEMGLMPR